jgi:hypothetical protein
MSFIGFAGCWSVARGSYDDLWFWWLRRTTIKCSRAEAE